MACNFTCIEYKNGASRNTLKQHLRTLVERGTLNQHGSGRGVWYDLR